MKDLKEFLFYEDQVKYLEQSKLQKKDFIKLVTKNQANIAHIPLLKLEDFDIEEYFKIEDNLQKLLGGSSSSSDTEIGKILEDAIDLAMFLISKDSALPPEQLHTKKSTNLQKKDARKLELIFHTDKTPLEIQESKNKAITDRYRSLAQSIIELSQNLDKLKRSFSGHLEEHKTIMPYVEEMVGKFQQESYQFALNNYRQRESLSTPAIISSLLVPIKIQRYAIAEEPESQPQKDMLTLSDIVQDETKQLDDHQLALLESYFYLSQIKSLMSIIKKISIYSCCYKSKYNFSENANINKKRVAFANNLYLTISRAIVLIDTNKNKPPFFTFDSTEIPVSIQKIRALNNIYNKRNLNWYEHAEDVCDSFKTALEMSRSELYCSSEIIEQITQKIQEYAFNNACADYNKAKDQLLQEKDLVVNEEQTREEQIKSYFNAQRQLPIIKAASYHTQAIIAKGLPEEKPIERIMKPYEKSRLEKLEKIKQEKLEARKQKVEQQKLVELAKQAEIEKAKIEEEQRLQREEERRKEEELRIEQERLAELAMQAEAERSRLEEELRIEQQRLEGQARQAEEERTRVAEELRLKRLREEQQAQARQAEVERQRIEQDRPAAHHDFWANMYLYM